MELVASDVQANDGVVLEKVVLLVVEDIVADKHFFFVVTFIRGVRLSSPASSRIDLIRFVDDFNEAFLLAPGFLPQLFGIPVLDSFVTFTPFCFF